MTRLLVECTHVFKHPTVNSGIQRVVRNVIQQLLDCGMQLQDEGELSAEFAASTTLAGMIAKLDIASVGPTGAEKLVAKLDSLDKIIAADGIDLRLCRPQRGIGAALRKRGCNGRIRADILGREIA